MWLNSLSSEEREAVLSAMRSVRARSDRSLDDARKLQTPGYTLPVGGQHFDHWLRGDTLAEFLGCLNKGATPEVAAEAAKVYAVECVRKWNANPRAIWFWNKCEVQRWEQTMDAAIDAAFIEVRRSLERAKLTIDMGNGFTIVSKGGAWEVSCGGSVVATKPTLAEALEVVEY